MKKFTRQNMYQPDCPRKDAFLLPMLVGWLVVLRIYVALAIFQPHRDLEAGDNQSLKSYMRDRESNPGPLAPQTKSLTTTQPLLPLTNVDVIYYC